MSCRILIAGIGNIFLGDDAFGVEVARRLMLRQWPDDVSVADFGIRGLDLAYALMDKHDAVVLVDAAPRGGPPGTLYVIEPEPGSSDTGDGDDNLIEAHSMDPVKVLRLAARMGAQPGRVFLVGCEPGALPEDDEVMGEMSAAVAAAVDRAVPLIEELIERLFKEELAPAQKFRRKEGCNHVKLVQNN
jgi:hydrogenase maturation protease